MLIDVCKKCGGSVFLDTLATAQEYNKETSIIIDENGDPTKEFLPEYMVFVCPKCNTRFKRTFDDMVLLLKDHVLGFLISIRNADSYKNVNRKLLREESGMSYCGMCPGPFEADGYCLNDLKNQCIIRKACLTIKDE